MPLYAFYESVSGYSLFEVREFEDVAKASSAFRSSLNEYTTVANMIHLVAYLPFNDLDHSLAAALAVIPGELTEMALAFIKANLPEKKGTQLAVYDNKLAKSLATVGITARCDPTTALVLRAIRQHYAKLNPGDSSRGEEAIRLCVSLGHAWSRDLVKFNPARSDSMVGQEIAVFDILAKNINQVSMRAREAYGNHFPELPVTIPESLVFCRVAETIGCKEEFAVAHRDRADGVRVIAAAIVGCEVDELEHIDPEFNPVYPLAKANAVAEEVFDLARQSMGPIYSAEDMECLMSLVHRAADLERYRAGLEETITTDMGLIAPNVTQLTGPLVGARLVADAGTLKKLASAPASTVQILGAQKALFHALKKRSKRTPKYGVIYHAPSVSAADARMKGRMARSLANKISLASRIDAFSDETPSNVYGMRLREMLDSRLQRMASGLAPERSTEAMAAVYAELEASKPKKAEKAKKVEKVEKVEKPAKEPKSAEKVVEKAEKAKKEKKEKSHKAKK